MTTPHPHDPIRQWMDTHNICSVAISRGWIAWAQLNPNSSITYYALELEPAESLIDRLNTSLTTALDPDPEIIEQARTLLRE